MVESEADVVSEGLSVLPDIARKVQRVLRYPEVSDLVSEVVVVGDTPRDVDCGRTHGTRTVAVATGRFGFDALCETDADVVLESLEETDCALRAILS